MTQANHISYRKIKVSITAENENIALAVFSRKILSARKLMIKSNRRILNLLIFVMLNVCMHSAYDLPIHHTAAF